MRDVAMWGETIECIGDGRYALVSGPGGCRVVEPLCWSSPLDWCQWWQRNAQRLFDDDTASKLIEHFAAIEAELARIPRY